MVFYKQQKNKTKQNLGSRMPVSILPGSCAGDTPYGLEESPLVHNFHNLKKKSVWESGKGVTQSVNTYYVSMRTGVWTPSNHVKSWAQQCVQTMGRWREEDPRAMGFRRDSEI